MLEEAHRSHRYLTESEGAHRGQTELVEVRRSSQGAHRRQREPIEVRDVRGRSQRLDGGHKGQKKLT